MWNSLDIDAFATDSFHTFPNAVRQEEEEQKPLPPVAQEGYQVASIWEEKAQLSDEQARAIEIISAHCSKKPLPKHISKSKQTMSAEVKPEIDSKHFSRQPLTDVVLEHSSDFYRWFSQLEIARSEEAEGRWKRASDILESKISICENALQSIDKALLLLEEIRRDQKSVSDRTAAVQSSCDRLLTHRTALEQQARVLGTRLRPLNDLDAVEALFGGSGTSTVLDDRAVLGALDQLENASVELRKRTEDATLVAALARCRKLQAQALNAVRARVHALLRAIVSAVLKSEAVRDQDTSLSTAGVTILCTRFLAASEPTLSEILKGLDARCAGPHASDTIGRLLRDCQVLYAESQVNLLRDQVKFQCSKLDGDDVVRSGWTFMIGVARVQLDQCKRFFPTSERGGLVVRQVVTPLYGILQNALRPHMDQTNKLADLAGLCQIVRRDIPSLADGSGDLLCALGEALEKTTQDMEERVAHRAKADMWKGITNYQPSSADLDYPTALQEGRTYLPVALAISMLTCLYDKIDPALFGSIGHSVLAGATEKIESAAMAITKKTADPLQGLLFKVSCLYTLSCQLDTFEEAEFTGKRLDLSHVGSYLKATLAGRLPLFSFGGRDDAGTTGIRIDAQLKGACEGCIMSITNTCLDPVLSFLTKVSARPGSPPLKELAFAHPERVTSLIDQLHASIAMHDTVRLVRLYLPWEEARGMIWKSVIDGIVEAYNQLETLLHQEYASDEIRLFTRQQLEHILSELK